MKQGLDVILDAAALNRADDSMLFLCVGNGSDCERIKRRAAELDLDNVRFLPLLDEKDFRGLMAASNVCLVTQQQSVSEIAFPSKIVTYLAAGRPMIASVNPECEVARITRESGAGSGGRGGESASAFGGSSRIEERRFAQGRRECARVCMHAVVVGARSGAPGAEPHGGGGVSNEFPGLERIQTMSGAKTGSAFLIAMVAAMVLPCAGIAQMQQTGTQESTSTTPSAHATQRPPLRRRVRRGRAVERRAGQQEKTVSESQPRRRRDRAWEQPAEVGRRGAEVSG